MKILISEDEDVSRSKMRLILSGYGDCVTAGEGLSTIDAFKQAHEMEAPFDVIFLDIDMPEINGIEVLNRIRKLENQMALGVTERSKIIMTTGYTQKEMVKICLRNGCDSYITKCWIPV